MGIVPNFARITQKGECFRTNRNERQTVKLGAGGKGREDLVPNSAQPAPRGEKGSLILRNGAPKGVFLAEGGNEKRIC